MRDNLNFLVDTNVISEIFKPKPNPLVKTWLYAQKRLGISVITIEELYYGLSYKNANKQIIWIERFLEYNCDIFTITADIAEKSGQLRARFRQKGITRTQSDLLIAATAYQYQLTVVTRNSKDFEDCEVKILNPFI